MAMIRFDHVTFAYPGSYDNVFEDCSFQFDTSWKLGLIGRNGRGKTTLLRLLQHQYPYTGTIIGTASFDYFPYPIEDKSRMTTDILNEICPTAEEWELLREFSYLELEPEVLWRPFGTLSNGEQTKALLAAFFLNEGHFPLIDEPTNHLDLHARQVVASYLHQKKGYILVSHDRAFLDDCVDHILSINKTTIDVQAGNFSSWWENFSRQQQFEEKQNERLQHDITRLRKSAARTSSWSDQIEASKYGDGSADKGYIGHQSAKMMKRAKAIAQRRERAIEQTAALLKNTEKAEALKIHPLTHHKKTLVTLSDVSVSYDENAVCDPVSFAVEQGERVCLTGKNGSGKSSLLKLILGQNIPHTGTVLCASGLIISYLPQDPSFLRGTLAEWILETGIDETLFKTILRKLDFERVQFEKPMQGYSQGQKKKVLIATSLCEKAHLYLWDEPLNYIDVYSRMQIEALLQTANPTMIFVEHDRVFAEQIATKMQMLS